ncbi:WD40 repeat-like protein [Rozella allomycis CSF55]|uniref:Cilia- and flagella-associated protein 52 n=1 Tax=Rozella allomycis (strain CSF55) TaxID=988480 RepID=A0A4P9YLT4_ROZAC|nr:WD40 repeat-like protein [Rozella allomycis CSF55]
MSNSIPKLNLISVNGFTGSIHHGLQKHPNGIHIIYPLGSNIVIKNEKSGEQEFLSGHTHPITCLAVSKCGKYIASGQSTHMGFQADILLWNMDTKKMVKKFSLHKGRVEALSFSPTSKYLASLGGEDDNSVIVWDIEKGAAICGTVASKDSSGVTKCLAYSNGSDLHFVTGGNNTLRVWEINPVQRKCIPYDCQMGQIKRFVKCIVVGDNDENMYCGTTTGDILMVNVKSKLFKKNNPVNQKNILFVGAGDGMLAIMDTDKMKILNKTTLKGAITSISIKNDMSVMVGTSAGNIFEVSVKDLSSKLISSCHNGKINDLVFPTIWNAKTGQELLRIHVPNLECLCITFNYEGSSLITGWSDGKIRAFGPETGRIQYEINDAHNGGVTAISITNSENNGECQIVSGGADGQVRVWRITKHTQILETAMKEHKERMVWNVSHQVVTDPVHVRNQVLFASNFFKAVCYYPDESQLLTTGTDRKIAYWEAFDGSLIRELELEADAINGLDISNSGKFFVCGGSDKSVKIYRYEEGDIVYEGLGHSSEITKLRISPDQQRIVSVGSDGAIFTWKFPEIQ